MDLTFACVCCAMCCGSYLTAVDDLGFGCLHVVPSVLLYLVSLALVCVFGFGADFALHVGIVVVDLVSLLLCGCLFDGYAW